MEAWPPEIQDQIQGFELPDGPIDIVIDCACALLDIPINNRVHALHQLLTLYQERFQDHLHFRWLKKALTRYEIYISIVLSYNLLK